MKDSSQKNVGGAYNLSRAVLAGVLAAGCLMPGFAEAASFNMDGGVEGTDYTKVGNIATITNVNNSVAEICWKSNNGNVEGCTINVENIIIENEIDIWGGFTENNGTVVTGNTVTIKDTTFKSTSEPFHILGGMSESSGNVTGNAVKISGNTTFESTSNIFGGGSESSGNVTGNTVEISGNTTFAPTSKIYGGYSVDGQAKGNSVSISGGTFRGGTYASDVYGGLGKTAKGNSVSISGGTFSGSVQVSHVYGGYGTTEANGNSVIISSGTFNRSEVHGGRSMGTAEDNSVIISGGTINGHVWGGYSDNGEAKNNKVILVGKNATYPLSAEQTLTGSGNIVITGVVAGAHAHAAHTLSGNEIHVYGSNTQVGKIEGFNTLRFFIDDKMTFGETMLTIKGVTNPLTVTISKDNLAVKVTGKPQASGDKNTITLVHNESNEITILDNSTLVPVEFGELLTGEGTVALVDNEHYKKDLVLTLKNIRVNENGKSLVETRAAAAFVVNNMSDFMLGQGMEQAKAAAGGVTPIDAGTMAPFAAVGGSNMRYTTGSYVDVNGWNGAVGFAKQADKLLFGVAVEHGRGNYDSYLDNGVHASGDIKSTGGVIFGEYKLDNGVHYDAALRAGRVKSDYSSTATSYDESSTYYGFSLGGGKELTVSDKATLDVYGRYYFSHTNGSDVSIATGEEIDFDAVNSHRLRIGGRYTTTLTEKSKAYAGLAWQYEFGGDAKAAINGYSAPTPSLQGHSAIVEAGYKLNAGKNLTLDFNLNGAMGKQRGIGGGIGAQWLF